jgi:D-glycero-alpha-D-manno-heptose-7-phosphate kinase
LDIWPLGVLQTEAVTVNAAVPVWVRLVAELDGVTGQVVHSVRSGGERRLAPSDAADDLTAAVCFALRPAGGLRIEVEDQPPIGSGVGGSSSYAVALARSVLALEDRRMTDEGIVRLARDLEARVMGMPAGVQDHWAAVRGGILAVHIAPGGTEVEKLQVSSDWLAERMSIFFTGITHHSGMVNWQVIRRRIEGERRTVDALERIAAAATRCRAALVAADDSGCAAAISDEWSARKQLAPEVCPPDLESIEHAAHAAGASAVKACGAGGGGSLLLWHPPGARGGLASVLESSLTGGRLLAAGVADRGCAVEALETE